MVVVERGRREREGGRGRPGMGWTGQSWRCRKGKEKRVKYVYTELLYLMFVFGGVSYREIRGSISP